MCFYNIRNSSDKVMKIIYELQYLLVNLRLEK